MPTYEKLTAEAVNAAVQRLALYRLEEHLSFPKLAERMEEAGCGLNVRTLHLALTRQVHPGDLTAFRIKQFVTDYVNDVPFARRLSQHRDPAAADAPRKRRRA